MAVRRHMGTSVKGGGVPEMREPFGKGRDLLQRSQYGYGGRGTRMAPGPQPRVTAAVAAARAFEARRRPADSLEVLAVVGHAIVNGKCEMSFYYCFISFLLSITSAVATVVQMYRKKRAWRCNPMGARLFVALLIVILIRQSISAWGMRK